MMNAAITDAQVATIIPGYQRGEAAAIEALYDLYADRLYRYLLARTGDLDVAADLTNELFLRVVKQSRKFRPRADCPAASLSAWLYRIGANLVADYYRAQGKQKTSPLVEAESLSAPDADPEKTAEQHEALEWLAEAMGTLTEEQRLVVVGKFGDGLSNREIADWLGKTEGAIESMQHRALRTLGRLLTAKKA